mgnify:CR=1 FL=1
MMREEEVLALIRPIAQAELSAWIAHGWVLPVRQGGACYYTEIDIARVRLIGEMRHDLQLDEEAIDVVLPLLDQVYNLRGSLRTFGSSIADPYRRLQRCGACGSGEVAQIFDGSWKFKERDLKTYTFREEVWCRGCGAFTLAEFQEED